MTLVSHSGCGCYSLVINEDHQLVFRKRCNDDYIFNSYYYVEIKHEISVVISVTPSESQFYINGELYNKIPFGTLFSCDKDLDIGSYGP